MSQNASHISWTFEEVDQRLKTIMQDMCQKIVTKAKDLKDPYNLIKASNIIAFEKVSKAMISEGI